VVRAGVPPRIMSEVMQVAAHLMMRKPFRRKHCKDEELSGVLGRKEESRCRAMTQDGAKRFVFGVWV
jgi:hypothetical protein